MCKGELKLVAGFFQNSDHACPDDLDDNHIHIVKVLNQNELLFQCRRKNEFDNDVDVPEIDYLGTYLHYTRSKNE